MYKFIKNYLNSQENMHKLWKTLKNYIRTTKNVKITHANINTDTYTRNKINKNIEVIHV